MLSIVAKAFVDPATLRRADCMKQCKLLRYSHYHKQFSETRGTAKDSDWKATSFSIQIWSVQGYYNTCHCCFSFFMGVLLVEINQFRMEQMKDRLPIKMQPLTKNDAPESEWLFDIDLNKRISLLNSTITALIKKTVSSCSWNCGKKTDTISNNSSHRHLQNSTKKYNTPKKYNFSGRALLKGIDWQDIRATDFRGTKFSK